MCLLSLQVYGWQPMSFNESANDPDDEFAQEAQKALGRVPDPNHIGVTCEGEVCVCAECLISHLLVLL